MITTVTNDKCYEFRGLSSDTKPTLTAESNGSTFFEIDTSDVYMFNGATLTWVKL